MSEYLKIDWNNTNNILIPTKNTFDNHKHNASDITAGGTIKGDIIVDGTFTSNSILPATVFGSENIGEQVPIVYLPEFSYSQVGVAVNASKQTFIKAWLKFICQHYTYTSRVLFIGSAAPSLRIYIQCYIYDTTLINDEGLPQYSYGMLQSMSEQLRGGCVFGTEEYNFYFNFIKSFVSLDLNTIRYELNIPAEIDITEDSVGFPFKWGSVVTRGTLGNSIGQTNKGDNYYWGTDSTGYLWAGRQINGAVNPTWVRAVMLNGELGHTEIWNGNLKSGTITLPKTHSMYAALIVYGYPGANENLVTSVIPAGSGVIATLSNSNYSIIYDIGTGNSTDLTLNIKSNTNNGTITKVWGICRCRS